VILAYFFTVMLCRLMVRIMVGALLFNMRMNHMRVEALEDNWKLEAVEVLMTICIAGPILKAMP
jgi:hypothetical protein